MWTLLNSCRVFVTEHSCKHFTFTLLPRITGVATCLTEEEAELEKIQWPAQDSGHPSCGVFGVHSPAVLPCSLP